MKRLLLVGAGHAHLGVLRGLRRQPMQGWEVTLVSPQRDQIYSGMLPGWISGHYALHEISLPVSRVSAAAGVAFRETEGVALDLATSVMLCADGEALPFDVVSLDVGAAGSIAVPWRPSPSSVPIRPLGRIVNTWSAAVERIGSQCSPFNVVIVGAGAAGVELAFAVRHRGLREGWSHLSVTLIGSDLLPLDGAPESARREIATLLRQRCVRWLPKRRATGIDEQQVDCADGSSVPFDLCWVAAGATAPQWLAHSGLALDTHGFVSVNASLQSVSHPHVFAAGDMAAHPRPLAKSGVQAVRAGAPLARSLRACCTGAALPTWRPRSRALNLISTSDHRAMAVWGDWRWTGKWAWCWKDAIDRRFVRSVVSLV